MYRTLIGRQRAAETIAPYVATAVDAIRARQRMAAEGWSR